MRTDINTESNENENECQSCGKSDNDTILMEILLPPVIMQRQMLCKDCLAVAIDSSKSKLKKKGKALEK